MIVFFAGQTLETAAASGYAITGLVTLSDQMMMRPRQSTSIERTPTQESNFNYCCLTSGTGSAVVDLIFSMAKREVTFLSDTAAIRRL